MAARMFETKLALRAVVVTGLIVVTASCGGSVATVGDRPSTGPQPPSGQQPGQPAPPPGGVEPPPSSCALPPSPTVTTLGTAVALHATLATNTSSVFWSEGIGGATVMRAAKTGSAAVAIPGATGEVAAADDAAVYVVTGAGNAADFGLVRVPLDGAAPTTIVAGSTSITAVAIDDARIYWAASGSFGDCFGDACPASTPSLSSAPKTGGPATTLGAFAPNHLHVDGDRLFFAFQVASDLSSANDGARTSIGAMPKGGGTPVGLVSRPNKALSDIALDATSVYWAESDLSDATPPAVMTASKGGGAPTTLATTATRDPQQLALDADGVYWLDDQTQALMRVAKRSPGAAPSVVVGDQVTASSFGGFGALAFDTVGLYWVADIACGPSCTGKIVSVGATCR